MTQHSVFTIGHSNHSLEAFLALLSRHAITAVADVRSLPASRVAPHFNRVPLQTALQHHGIHYLFFGRILGGRPTDPACYENGRVKYERLAQTALFQHGLERLLHIARNYRVALLCSEKEPLECHRALLIGHLLHERGVTVQHILADGRLENHAETLQRLFQRLRLPPADLFHSPQEAIAAALAQQARRVAWFQQPATFRPRQEQL